jgi:hypothetical protein
MSQHPLHARPPHLSRPSLPSRRAVLRGALGGAAVSLALPFLESLLPRSLTPQARAQLSLSPKRFVMYFWGNGAQMPRWIPPEEGASWTLMEQLASLAPVRDRVALVTGLEVKTGNTEAHISGPAGFFTGMPYVRKPTGDWTFGGPSLDQRVAAAIGGETLYRSLEVGVEPHLKGLSFSGPDSRNTPESDPLALYERLFGATFREPGSEGGVDPRLGLRRSVLDAVLADSTSLRSRLGVQDRARLEQHMSAVRDLELRLTRLAETPARREACVRPEPPLSLAEPEGRVLMAERARLMADLSVMALACDMTRVLSFWFSDPLSSVLYPNATLGHHQLTHDEPGDQPQVNEIVKVSTGGLAYLLEGLAGVAEGEGSLLDSAAVLATTDISEGRTHQIDEYPIVLAGRANGALRVGHHYRSHTKESTSHLALSLLRALDVLAESYGEGEAYVTAGLSAVEV